MLEQKLDKISQENQNQVVNIKISDVYPNGDQPRIYFDEDKIIALCESIKKHGVLQPIVVRPDDEGRYMIIAGERRYRASIMANKESIPAIIKDMPIKEVLEIALVENLQRENLNIIEEAKAYKNLIDKHKSTQEELAELVGKSRPYITNTMRLLNLSDEVKKYMETWKKYCPYYEITEWNESNFDVNQNQYCREAYEAGKWAFVSDYARLKILYDYGGIYMDTDMEVCKPLDRLASYAFWSGFESESQFPTGIMASCRDNELLGYLLSYYNEKHFKDADGSYDTTTNVITITKMIKDKYNVELNNTFQIFGENYAIFPFEYFCAKDFFSGKVSKTENTYTIHHFNGSWLNKCESRKIMIRKILINLIGVAHVKKILYFKRWVFGR